jgi:hypothetical protein
LNLTLKAFNVDEREMGRGRLNVSVKKGDVQYADFPFDERTHLLQTEYLTIK